MSFSSLSSEGYDKDEYHELSIWAPRCVVSSSCTSLAWTLASRAGSMLVFSCDIAMLSVLYLFIRFICWFVLTLLRLVTHTHTRTPASPGSLSQSLPCHWLATVP